MLRIIGWTLIGLILWGGIGTAVGLGLSYLVAPAIAFLAFILTTVVGTAAFVWSETRNSPTVTDRKVSRRIRQAQRKKYSKRIRKMLSHSGLEDEEFSASDLTIRYQASRVLDTYVSTKLERTDDGFDVDHDVSHDFDGPYERIFDTLNRESQKKLVFETRDGDVSCFIPGEWEERFKLLEKSRKKKLSNDKSKQLSNEKKQAERNFGL